MSIVYLISDYILKYFKRKNWIRSVRWSDFNWCRFILYFVPCRYLDCIWYWFQIHLRTSIKFSINVILALKEIMVWIMACLLDYKQLNFVVVCWNGSESVNLKFDRCWMMAKCLWNMRIVLDVAVSECFKW